MKIIITYASAGAGHFKAAEAIYYYFKEQHKEIEVEIIDVVQKTNALFRLVYTFGYSLLINHALFLWRLAFLLTYARLLRKGTRVAASFIHRLNSKALSRFLKQENPDFIISTHFFPSEIAAHLKKNRKIRSRVISVITDFGVHPFWVSEGTDSYVVASEYTKKILMLEGIDETRIRLLGIPIDPKFLHRRQRGDLCKKISIEQGRFTVLIVSGSFGIGPVEEIVDLLYKEVQILVVCARNKNLFARLKNKNYPQVLVYGFVENMQDLMAASDVIITKPGGMSISELLVMELVPIFISAIPGQETENIKAMEEYGIGVTARNAGEIRSIVLDYLGNPDKLNSIREKIKEIKRPYAVQELGNAVCADSIRAGG